jgi:hypothetical protein
MPRNIKTNQLPLSTELSTKNSQSGKKLLIWLFLLFAFCIVCILAITASNYMDDLKKRSEAMARCIPASQQQIELIRAGIKKSDPGNDIEKVYSIKSNDFENSYMLAGSITGTFNKPGDATGVWLIIGNPNTPQVAIAIDELAEAYSSYSSASELYFDASMTSDGAKDVKICAQSVIK